MYHLNYKILLLFTVLIFNCFLGFSQAEPNSDPLLFDTYQIFLDEPIKEIKRLEYESEDKRLKGYLIDDKTGIILDNYDGKHRVKITYVDLQGETKTLLKSKCYIDPVIPL